VVNNHKESITEEHALPHEKWSSVDRVVDYHEKGPGIESNLGALHFSEVKHALLLHWCPTK